MTLFEYRDMHQRPAKTGLTVGEYAGMNVCIFSELTSNPGASVTNSTTQVINQVIEQRNLPDDTRFFEHYHWGDELPSVDEVVVTKKDGQVCLRRMADHGRQFCHQHGALHYLCRYRRRIHLIPRPPLMSYTA